MPPVVVQTRMTMQAGTTTVALSHGTETTAPAPRPLRGKRVRACPLATMCRASGAP